MKTWLARRVLDPDAGGLYEGYTSKPGKHAPPTTIVYGDDEEAVRAEAARQLQTTPDDVVLEPFTYSAPMGH